MPLHKLADGYTYLTRQVASDAAEQREQLTRAYREAHAANGVEAVLAGGRHSDDAHSRHRRRPCIEPLFAM
jgi:hypothetical protein